ncbi:MAG: leucine-rich repeat domain-containing protein [Candidatus Gastranaerophilales bacterium]|nr:leucine-rich repeat domain-containing protein [Candidatus Gastranaerophilales bacterium]
MKKQANNILLAIMILLLFAMLVACDKNELYSDEKISVMLSAGEGFNIEGDFCKEILPGENVEFFIDVEEEYAIEDVNYANGKYQLNSVYYPTVINLNVRKKSVVRYVVRNDDSKGDITIKKTNNKLTQNEIYDDQPLTLEVAPTGNNYFMGFSIDNYLLNGGTKISSSLMCTIKQDEDFEVYANYFDFSKPSIIYNNNGGLKINGSTETFSAINYDLSIHPRPNTSIGTDSIAREGYVQTGWNTKADLTGEHIGLGSRVTIKESIPIELYAEWQKWSSAQNFEYQILEENAIITKYIGNEQTIVIPEKIDGKNVAIINENAFLNTYFETLVLPKTIYKINEYAFNGCSFNTIYFYDNLIEVGDKSFNDCNNLSKVCINAIIPPKSIYFKTDTYDLMILNHENHKKQLIYFSGSSGLHGVSMEKLNDEFADYDCLNLGAGASMSAVIQLAIIDNYISRDDVLIHGPENSPAQSLLAKKVYNNSLFECILERNWDLMSLVDCTSLSNFFNKFSEFNRTRAQIANSNYDFVSHRTTWRGDYNFFSNPHDETWYDYEIPLNNYLDVSGLEKRREMYYGFLNKGVKVFFTFPPTNINAVNAVEGQDQNYIDEVINANIFENVPVLLTLNETLYTGNYFFDSSYHPCTSGMEIHTQKLIEALRPYLEQ